MDLSNLLPNAQEFKGLPLCPKCGCDIALVRPLISIQCRDCGFYADSVKAWKLEAPKDVELASD